MLTIFDPPQALNRFKHNCITLKHMIQKASNIRKVFEWRGEYVYRCGKKKSQFYVKLPKGFSVIFIFQRRGENNNNEIHPFVKVVVIFSYFPMKSGR